MEDPYIGEIALFAGNFAPVGWAFCDGTVLQIQQYSALYSILGTNYGGNGTTNFALPDLRGRAPISFGTGPGLTPRVLGQKFGSETTALTEGQLPKHTHIMGASAQPADQAAPTGNVLAVEPTGSSAMYHAEPINTAMNASAIGTAGNNQPFSVLQPCIAINYIIALVGIYPQHP
jgi:microcystin-dependent protein